MADKLFEIEVTADKKAAYLTVLNFNGLNKETIFYDMVSKNITAGTLIKNISQIFDEQISGEKVIIARAREPLDAEPEQLEFLLDLSIRPKEIGLRVDFYDLNYIKDVAKGTPIFKIKPAKATQRGYLINGTPVLSPNGYQTFPSTNFTNIEFLPDQGGWQIGVATVDGSLTVEAGEIAIVHKIRVSRNLDLNVGNLISQYSDIEVFGDVKDGFKISSPARVYIGGNLENSQITAHQLVVEDRILSGRKTITTHTLTAANIIGRKAIYTEKLIVSGDVRGCEVGVLDSADIGTLSESEIFVNNSLEVNTAGSSTAIITTIYLGVDKLKFDDQLNIQKKIDELKTKNRELNIERVKTKNELDELLLLKRKNDFSTIYDAVIAYLEDENSFLEKELAANAEKEKEMLAEIDQLAKENCNRQAELIVKNKIYQRTVISFGLLSRIQLEKNYGSCRIYLNPDNEIVIDPIEQIRQNSSILP